jgi:hypothetical protein
MRADTVHVVRFYQQYGEQRRGGQVDHAIRLSNRDARPVVLEKTGINGTGVQERALFPDPDDRSLPITGIPSPERS